MNLSDTRMLNADREVERLKERGRLREERRLQRMKFPMEDTELPAVFVTPWEAPAAIPLPESVCEQHVFGHVLAQAAFLQTFADLHPALPRLSMQQVWLCLCLCLCLCLYTRSDTRTQTQTHIHTLARTHTAI